MDAADADAAFHRRCHDVLDFFYAISYAGQEVVGEAAELACRLCFDPRSTKLDPLTDAIRRTLFKLSCIKTYIEYHLGSYVCQLEPAHRHRLLYQTSADYFVMLENAEYPPTEVIFPPRAAVDV